MVQNLFISCSSDEHTMSVSNVCYTDCPPLSNINNGRVSTDGGLSTGQNATYSCNNGYHLTGDSVRTCQENGTWDNEEPTCQIIGNKNLAISEEILNLSEGNHVMFNQTLLLHLTHS